MSEAERFMAGMGIIAAVMLVVGTLAQVCAIVEMMREDK